MDTGVHSEMGNEGNAQVGGQRGDQGGSTHSGLTPPFDQRAVGLQTDHDIMHDGQARKFHFFVPPDVSDQDTYPLSFFFMATVDPLIRYLALPE